jgi:hypothetical protein
MGASNKLGWIRVYNVTDAVVEWEANIRPPLNTVQSAFSGFHYVTLAGVAKVYKMQYRSDAAGDTTYLKDAHLELWRVI